MKNLLSIILLLGISFSCKPPANQNSYDKAPIDSLIANFCKSWNNHDSIAVRKLFDPGALVNDDNTITTNLIELSNFWIKPYIYYINNLNTTKLQEWSTSDRAGYTGKYKLDFIDHDSLIGRPQGVILINWIKNEKGEWKITTAILHAFVGQN